MIYVNSVIVSIKNVTLNVGQWCCAVSAQVSPVNAYCKDITWHSDNPTVASVNVSNGYICANAAGTAKIYATATDGSGCSDYITVTVNVNDTVAVTSVH